MTAIDLRAWQQRHGYTYDSAAEELGMGRRTYADYLRREGELPRWLMLACLAVDAGLQDGDMTEDDLRAWQQRHGYTYDSAAEELGMGRRTYADYLKREGELPRWLMLACLAVDHGLANQLPGDR